MKIGLFTLLSFTILLSSCSNEDNSFNAKTIDYATKEMKQQIPVLQMRALNGGIWRSIFSDSVIKNNTLEDCLFAFENLYAKIPSQQVELSASEEYFFEDIEYLEKQMPCAATKRKVECSTENEEDKMMLRIAQTLQNIRKENYYRDLFILNSVEGKDTTETIAQIKNMVLSYINTSCGANSLIRVKNTYAFNDSLSSWLSSCKLNLHAEQKEYLDAFTDSLGYKKDVEINYPLAKVLCDVQLIDLQVRKLQYGAYTFSVELNPKVNIKLLSK